MRFTPARALFDCGAGAELQARTGREVTIRRRRSEAVREQSARASAVAARLMLAYPEVKVPLHHKNAFELLVAVLLSAQCTDDAVNKVTPELFESYPDPESLANASRQEIEAVIRRLGLFRAKAKSLQLCARQLAEKFGGRLPSRMEDLVRLAGVGRKTANVILAHVFRAPAIVVDTHCRRVSRRLRLTRREDPAQIERDLKRLLPHAMWTDFSHRLIIHGKNICHARKPACGSCILSELCPSRKAFDQTGAPA